MAMKDEGAPEPPWDSGRVVETGLSRSGVKNKDTQEREKSQRIKLRAIESADRRHIAIINVGRLFV
jgi:hypothetical protein